jgi:glycosyltransferase involved in cell wall biosynthesis
MMHKKIVMLGTTSQGGIASVVDVYRAAGLFQRFPIVYLATHRGGGPLAKLGALLLALAKFGALLLGGQVAVVHIHVASRASFWRKSLFFWLARPFRVRTILHLHGGEFSVFYHSECGPVRRALVRAVFERATRIVVLSAAWKDFLATITRNPNIEAIHNPVIVPGQPAWEQRRPGQVVFLGKLGPNKGSYDLLEAASMLLARRRQLELMLGGDGEVQQTRARVSELGIGEHVKVLGWVGPEQRNALLASASVFVLPSYHEGLPMSILEAMAAGLPVLATPVGGIPELLTDGVEGYLVQPGDVEGLGRCMQSLLDDQALAQRMGAAGRRKIETTFSAGAVLPRVEKIYQDLGIQPV